MPLQITDIPVGALPGCLPEMPIGLRSRPHDPLSFTGRLVALKSSLGDFDLTPRLVPATPRTGRPSAAAL